MKIINSTPRALPAALPPQDISKTGTVPSSNLDIHLYGADWQDFYLVIEDTTGSNISYSAVEVEIFGYFANDHTPMLIYKASLDSDRGKMAIPITDMPAIKYLYFRQAADTNAISTAGNPNAACQYQIVFNAKWSNG